MIISIFSEGTEKLFSKTRVLYSSPKSWEGVRESMSDLMNERMIPV